MFNILLVSYRCIWYVQNLVKVGFKPGLKPYSITGILTAELQVRQWGSSTGSSCVWNVIQLLVY